MGLNRLSNAIGAQPTYASTVCGFFPQFLITHNFFFLVSTFSRYASKTIYVDRGFWARVFFLFKLQLPCLLSYVVDGLQYKALLNDWIFQFNCNTMISDDRLSVCSNVSLFDFSVLSVGGIFSSTIWLERELSDFTGVTFFGLVDTRRLLLDYFEEKQSWQTHISNDKNFNNVYYDTILSF